VTVHLIRCRGDECTVTVIVSYAGDSAVDSPCAGCARTPRRAGRGQAALAAALAALGGGGAAAQDAVKVDPSHYKVLVNNAQVRVLRIHYGPHETSKPHAHPNSVVTYLTDARTKMDLPGGKSMVMEGKAGESAWAPAGIHTPATSPTRRSTRCWSSSRPRGAGGGSNGPEGTEKGTATATVPAVVPNSVHCHRVKLLTR